VVGPNWLVATTNRLAAVQVAMVIGGDLIPSCQPGDCRRLDDGSDVPAAPLGGETADTLAPVFLEDAARLADALGPAARRDLLRVLTSPSEVRADFIRQLHERDDAQEMADLLIFLEQWEWARQRMIEELSRA
jgi:hypothetical protein